MSFDKFKSIASGAPNIMLMNIIDSYKRASPQYPVGYETANVLLFGLGKFLLGFEEGVKIDEPPKPQQLTKADSRDRAFLPAKHMQENKDYFTEHFPLIMQRLGMYEQSVIKALSMRSTWGYQGDVQLDA